MNTCYCSGNNSARIAIGGPRCECGGRLTQEQFNVRVISRLDECDEEITRLIGALQVLGADRCDQCGLWAKDCWTCGDKCQCRRCLEQYPEGPLQDEELTDDYDATARSIVRYLSARGAKIRSKELLAVRATLT
jgi:hypothetical protein